MSALYGLTDGHDRMGLSSAHFRREVWENKIGIREPLIEVVGSTIGFIVEAMWQQLAFNEPARAQFSEMYLYNNRSTLTP